MSDIDTVVVDGLKALDLERPIREADLKVVRSYVCFQRQIGHGEFGRLLAGLQIGDFELRAAALTLRPTSACLQRSRAPRELL